MDHRKLEEYHRLARLSVCIGSSRFREFYLASESLREECNREGRPEVWEDWIRFIADTGVEAQIAKGDRLDERQ